MLQYSHFQGLAGTRATAGPLVLLWAAAEGYMVAAHRLTPGYKRSLMILATADLAANELAEGVDRACCRLAVPKELQQLGVHRYKGCA